MNTKTICALACACIGAHAYTLDVSCLQDGYNFRLGFGTDIEPRVAGNWSIDQTNIGYGGSQGIDSFLGSPTLPENFATLWPFLAPGSHTVSFASDDGTGLVLTSSPFYIYDPVTGELPGGIIVPPDGGGSAVPETMGCATLALTLAGMIGFRRRH